MKDIDRVQQLAQYFIKHDTVFCDMVDATSKEPLDEFFHKDDFRLIVDYCEFFGAISDDILTRQNQHLQNDNF